MPDQPEGRINLVHHLTPEALWQERFLRHANNARHWTRWSRRRGSSETAARFSRLVGCVVIPDPAGGFALDLAHGRVRLCCPTRMHRRFRASSVERAHVDGNAAIAACWCSAAFASRARQR